MISAKQLEANRRNAMRSTGPTTPEGKAAVRLNALRYGLRARSLLIPGEDPADYEQLWADLKADWQPHNRSEQIYLEQMTIAQWLLARMAAGERGTYEIDMPLEKQLALLERFSAQRVRLEHSFANAMRNLEHLQQQRHVQPGEPACSTQLTGPEMPQDNPAYYAAATPDSR